MSQIPTTLRADATKSSHKTIPGEPGLWVFLFGDMVLFILFFGSFLVERAANLEIFEASRLAMSPVIGIVNTLILLTSSFLVVVGMHAYRGRANAIAARALSGALLLGLAFIVFKGVEYTHLIGAGNGPGSNLYYTYFFILTGLHLMHVMIGIVTLVIMLLKARHADEPSTKDFSTMDSCACYWHLVDLLWMIIFPLLYLVG